MQEAGFMLVSFSAEFEVKVRVHQGSVLSPLLFIIVLEALSHEFHAGFVCLFDLILYVHSTIFQLCRTVFLG